MTGITEDGIVIAREYAAHPSDVFAAWTSADSFRRWFGGHGVEIAAEGLDYSGVEGREWSARMLLPDGNTIDWGGEFVEVRPTARLVLTLTDRPADPQRAALVVEISPSEDGARMRMSQETPGFTQEQRQATIDGWQGFLDVLGEIAEAATAAGTASR